MISTSTMLSNTVSGALHASGYYEIAQPVKTASAFSNQKGSDTFVPGRTLSTALFESYEDISVGQGEFANTQKATVFSGTGAPTFMVPKVNQIPPSFEQNAVSTWINGNALLVKKATAFITAGPMYDSSTFFFNNVFLPITFSESTMQSSANNVSSQAIRQYWS